MLVKGEAGARVKRAVSSRLCRSGSQRVRVGRSSAEYYEEELQEKVQRDVQEDTAYRLFETAMDALAKVDTAGAEEVIERAQVELSPPEEDDSEHEDEHASQAS